MARRLRGVASVAAVALAAGALALVCSNAFVPTGRVLVDKEVSTVLSGGSMRMGRSKLASGHGVAAALVLTASISALGLAARIGVRCQAAVLTKDAQGRTRFAVPGPPSGTGASSSARAAAPASAPETAAPAGASPSVMLANSPMPPIPEGLVRAPTPKPAVPPEYCRNLDVSKFQFPEKFEGEWKFCFGDFINLLGEWRGAFEKQVIDVMITNQATGARRIVSYDVDTPLSKVKDVAIKEIGYDLPWLAVEDFKLGPLDGTVKDAYLDETKTLKDIGCVNKDELLIWFDGI